MTRALLDLLAARRVSLTHGDGERFRLGQTIHVPAKAAIEPYVGIYRGDYLPRTMGAFSYSNTVLGMMFDIGRYCSLAGGLRWFYPEHPTAWVATSPFSYEGAQIGFLRAYLTDIAIQAPFPQHQFDGAFITGVRFGNDVWTGQDIAVKDGISIGDGAVIAARAVVTRDVAPYTIVGGSPARVIRQRFDDALVERLLALKWWRFGPEVVQAMDVRDPAGFVSRLEDASVGLKELSFTPLRYGEMEAASLQEDACEPPGTGGQEPKPGR